MKAVFFKCQIPLEFYSIDTSGNINVRTEMRNMEQGEVVECNYSEGIMEIGNATWWNPDRKLFNLVGQGSPAQSCCG